MGRSCNGLHVFLLECVFQPQCLDRESRHSLHAIGWAGSLEPAISKVHSSRLYPAHGDLSRAFSKWHGGHVRIIKCPPMPCVVSPFRILRGLCIVAMPHSRRNTCTACAAR